MSDPTFDIAFYGIIQPEKDKDTVIQNMARLFKTTPEKVRPYFAGGRKIIKSKVDRQTAEKYHAALDNIGLVIKIEAREPAATAAGESQTSDISVAPVGADVVEHPPEVPPQPIGDISHMTMAKVGADVLEHPTEVTARAIADISHITMAEVGADVLENPPEVTAQPIGDISHITMAEVGADVFEQPPPRKKTPIPDTSDLSVDDKS